jgi:hypothetical protein
VLTRLAALASKPLPASSHGPGKVPQRIKLLDWGNNESAKGPIILNADFSAFQEAMNWKEVAGDFEHTTVPSSPNYKGEPQKIAGNFQVEILTGDGIYASLINATPEGDDHVGGGHYRDISPAVLLNEKNEVIGLHSFAFCRKGAVKNLTLFSSAYDPAAQAREPIETRKQAGPQNAEEFLSIVRTKKPTL